MDPERLIIEVVRDKLRAAWEELSEVQKRAQFAEGHWTTKRDLHGFERAGELVSYDNNEHRSVIAGYSASISTARAAADNWERALTVALDKLTGR